MIVKFGLVLSIVLFVSCNGTLSMDKHTVEDFDDKYRSIISNLTNSLIFEVGRDTSYLIEARRDVRDIHFSYIDSSGKGGDYFRPRFRITNDQAEFLLDAVIGDIFYNKKYDNFSMKLFAFKNGDKTIYLDIYMNPKNMRIDSNENVIYFNEGRVYKIGNAW